MSITSTPPPGQGPLHLPTNARFLYVATSPWASGPEGSSLRAPTSSSRAGRGGTGRTVVVRPGAGASRTVAGRKATSARRPSPIGRRRGTAGRQAGTGPFPALGPYDDVELGRLPEIGPIALVGHAPCGRHLKLLRPSGVAGMRGPPGQVPRQCLRQGIFQRAGFESNLAPDAGQVISRGPPW